MKLSLSLLAGKRNQWTSYLRFKNRLCPCKRHKNWKVGQIWSRSYAWNFACFHRSWRQLCRLSTQYHGSHVPHCCLHKGSVDSFLLFYRKLFVHPLKAWIWQWTSNYRQLMEHWSSCKVRIKSRKWALQVSYFSLLDLTGLVPSAMLRTSCLAMVTVKVSIC